MKNKAFTLIELLISIAIATIIASAVYFGLNTALETWQYTKDELAIQKILHEAVKEITDGTAVSFGVKDSLEIISAGRERIEFVPPWTDDTHTVREVTSTYTLNKKLKPGVSSPIAETRSQEADIRRFMPTILVEGEAIGRTDVALAKAASPGHILRFTFHPDYKASSDVIKTIWYDPEEKEIFCEYNEETENISKNSLGVKITGLEFRYYNKRNELITDSDWVEPKDIPLITGIEIIIKAELAKYKREVMSFVSIQNAPMRSGYFPLAEKMEIPIPNSHKIHTLLVTNISGAESEDVLQLRAIPENGKEWRIRIIFSRAGLAEPKIERYIIEYPTGSEVYTEYPRMSTAVGFDLLMMGQNGKYDYDYDGGDIEDIVIVEGDVTLEVERMDIEGAGLFLRP